MWKSFQGRTPQTKNTQHSKSNLRIYLLFSKWAFKFKKRGIRSNKELTLMRQAAAY